MNLLFFALSDYGKLIIMETKRIIMYLFFFKHSIKYETTRQYFFILGFTNLYFYYIVKFTNFRKKN